MAIMAILKVPVFVKFVEVYGAFAFALYYMCMYTYIVNLHIITTSTCISEANGITIFVDFSESNGDIHVQTGQEECSCRSI